MRRSRNGIASTFIASVSGRLIDVRPKSPSIIGVDFSYRDWYQGVTALQRPYVSDAIRSAARGNPLVVVAAAPVRAILPSGRQGKMIAIIGAAYDLRTIDAFTQRFLSSGGAALTITDQHGTVVAGPTSSSSTLVSDKGSPQVDAALEGRSGVLATTRGGKPLLTAYSPVPGIGWAATVDIPGHAAAAAGSRLRVTVLAISAVLASVLVAALVLLALTLRERRRAEERLAVSERSARSIIEAAGQAFVAMDLAGTITGWNRRAEETFGWAREDVLGRSISEVLLLSGDGGPGQPRLSELFATEKGGVQDRRLDVVARHRGGRTFPASVTMWPVVLEGHRSFSAFVEDITERKAAEEKIRFAQLAAEEASLAKSQFLSRVSHELRTPLNAILGFGQLLALDELAPEQQESVHEIIRGGRHLLELINEVLDISRIETGQLSLSLEPVSLDDVVGDCMSLVAPLAAERSIVLDRVTCGDGIHVAADRQRLKQVVLNLLSNAIKYNLDGGTVIVSSRELDARAEITVTDTGPGISAARLKRLFTPFDRLGRPSAPRSRAPGSGCR